MARIKDWPTYFLGDIKQFKRMCPVCGKKVGTSGLFWLEGENLSFYHTTCAAVLVDGLKLDVAMIKIKELPF